MNKFSSFIMPLCGMMAPVLAMDAVHVQKPYNLSDGSTLTITFPVAMVEADAVGSVVQLDGLQIEQPLQLEASWVSRSELSIEIKGEPDPLRLYDISLPPRWKGALGEVVELEKSVYALGRRSPIRCNNYTWGNKFKPFIFHLDESLSLEQLQPYTSRAYFEEFGSGGKRLPAQLRPLTVGEILSDWDYMKDNLCYARLTEEDREAFAAMPPEEIVPSYWIADYRIMRGGELKIPDLGSRISDTREYEPLSVCRFSRADLTYYVSNQRMEDGRYRVEVAFETPALGDDAESVAQQITWGAAPFRYSKPTHFVPSGDLGDSFNIHLDEEASNKYKLQVEGKGGFTKLIFIADTKSVPHKLRCRAYLPTIAGQSIPKVNVEKDDMDTVLKPEEPRIRTNLEIGGLQSVGNRCVRVKHSSLDELKVKLVRLDQSPQAVIRTMNLYEKYYLDRSEDLASILPVQLLPTSSELKEKDLPIKPLGGETEIKMNDEEFFPDVEHGFFFVEFEGKPSEEWKKADSIDAGKQIYNQNLVQLTDLGLMWKKSGQQIYVYSYHLSTGKPLEQGLVTLLDEKGKTLEEKTIGVTGVLFKIPSRAVRWMQVKCGEDCYMTKVNLDRDALDSDYYADFDPYIDRGQLPETKLYTFTDREVYRPGEVVHFKGILRDFCGNDISIPTDVSALELIVNRSDGGEVSRHSLSVEADGSFSCDIPLPSSSYSGTYRINIKLAREGDDKEQSKDMKLLEALSHESENLKYLAASYLKSNRVFRRNLTVGDYRRNEFELESTLSPLETERMFQLEVQAMNLNGTPLAEGDASWYLQAKDTNFYPKGYKDYLFGDHRAWDPNLWMEYYQGRTSRQAYGERFRSQTESKLDARGYGRVELPLMSGSFPRRQLLEAVCMVRNGNGQMLSSVQESVFDPAELYVGLKSPSKYSHAGEGSRLALDVLLLDKKGQPYLEATSLHVEVERELPHQYRLGIHRLSQVMNDTVIEPVLRQDLTISEAKAQVSIPLSKAGSYQITVSGKDAEGKEFRSAIKHVVWAEGTRSWDYQDRSYTSIESDKDIYQAGDTARLLVQSPIEGTVLVSVEREKILRQFLCELKGENPIIDIPLLKDDVPSVTVSLFTVQGDRAARGEDGLPLVELSSTELRLDPTEQRLKLELDLPKDIMQVSSECELSGQVLDAAGQPVPQASVTFYAEDEGSLQAGGYHNPDPLSSFYSTRSHLVRSYSALNQILGEGKEDIYYGNKGVFIGGGFSMNDEGGISLKEEGTAQRFRPALRLDFSPCAFWTSRLVTDDQGRFSTSFKNPDLLTRFRVIAVANAGATQFGVGIGSYEVSKSIMLEPSAPLAATLGDKLDLPVTVSMNPKMLPESLRDKAQSSIAWRVELQGDDQSAPLLASQTIDLTADVPQTLHFTVDMKQCGLSQLKWTVVPDQAELASMGLGDALMTDFTINPPTPYLKEAFFESVPAGSTVQLSDMLKTSFDAQASATVVLSPSPLAAAMTSIDSLRDYPYECSEQLSSRLWPLLMADVLQKGMGLPAESKWEREAKINEIISELQQRSMRYSNAACFSYWPHTNRPSIFSSSVLLALIEAQRCGYIVENSRIMSIIFKEAKEALLKTYEHGNKTEEERALTHPLMLLCLAEAKQLDKESLLSIIEKQAGDEAWQSAEAKTLIALVMQKISPDDAPAFISDAVACKKKSKLMGMPPLKMLQFLLQIEKVPRSGFLADLIHTELRRYAYSVHNTTFETAWMVLVLSRYIEATGVDTAVTSIDGQDVSAELPLIMEQFKMAQPKAWAVEKAPAYCFGVAEGYTTEKQEPAVVDKGFRISRRYEKLLEAGQWEPSESFRVGDIVRITLSIKNSTDEVGQYVAVEDYMPAGLELVNPDIRGQALPSSISANDGTCWRWGSYVSYKQYHKDRLSIFIDSCPKDSVVDVHYIARVVKSGQMTAPAAKAEMMYKPQIYGLSIPMKMEVKADK